MQQVVAHYFHCDQIGISREMTDKDGNLLWYGEYTAWGRLKNQYFDEDTGLYFNFFRHYEAECGRFINLNPIRLWGGDNLYSFAPSTLMWIDALDWHSEASHKCTATQVVRNADKKLLAPCINCAPVVQALGV